MPMIKRDDAISFAIHAYREQLALTSTSKTLAAIRRLAPQHGQYIRVLRRAQVLEVVFSREPGFLLGEAVWRYFGECDDLIYCEVLPVAQQVLLVVVQAGRVHVDTKLSLLGLRAELAAMSLSERSYKVYHYGHLPMFEASDKAFALDGIRYQFIQSLEASVFESLPVHTDIQLQPLAMALRSQYLGRRNGWPMFAGVLVACVAYAFWHSMTLPMLSPPSVSTQVVYDQPSHYQQLLRGPGPYKLLHDLLGVLAEADAVAGWRVSAVTWHTDGYRLNFQAHGGSRDALWRWAQAHHGQLSLGDKGVTVRLAKNLTDEQRAHMPRLAEMVWWQGHVLDALKALLPDAQVVVSPPQRAEALHQAHVKISVVDISPSVLDLLARRLTAMPVRLQSMAWQQHDALLSGTIELTLVGK